MISYYRYIIIEVTENAFNEISEPVNSILEKLKALIKAYLKKPLIVKKSTVLFSVLLKCHIV